MEVQESRSTTMNASGDIFVTGASGFIGSHLVRRLIENGCRVSIMARPSSNLWRIRDLLPRLHCHYGDLTDEDETRSVVRKLETQGVFHLAASNMQSGVTVSDEELVKVNILGTANLLKALEGQRYDFFVYTGSFLEYGPRTQPIREADPCRPQELYSISKLAATLLVQRHAQQKGKPAIVFRVFTPYGPFVQKGRLIYEIVSRALAGEEIPLTSPAVTRDFIFIEDLVDLLIEGAQEAGRKRGEIFNAGSGRATSLGEIVNCIIQMTASPSDVRWGAFREVAYDRSPWQADMAKTFSHFRWRPRHTIEAGITKTIEWFKNFPPGESYD